jgi:hypothetical protein
MEIYDAKFKSKSKTGWLESYLVSLTVPPISQKTQNALLSVQSGASAGTLLRHCPVDITLVIPEECLAEQQ